MDRYYYQRTLMMCLITMFPFVTQAQVNTTTTTNEVTIEKHAIITPAPKAVCTSVAAHWEGNIWVDAHNICKYTDRTEGVAWVDSYWSCVQASADGTCSAWSLVPGHWATTLPQ